MNIQCLVQNPSKIDKDTPFEDSKRVALEWKWAQRHSGQISARKIQKCRNGKLYFLPPEKSLRKNGECVIEGKLSESVCEREKECAWVCVRERKSVCVKERKSARRCVCEREREREKERKEGVWNTRSYHWGFYRGRKPGRRKLGKALERVIAASAHKKRLFLLFYSIPRPRRCGGIPANGVIITDIVSPFQTMDPSSNCQPCRFLCGLKKVEHWSSKKSLPWPGARLRSFWFFG